MSRRYKPAPLDLFSIATQSFEDEVFEKFREYAFKLIAQGFFSICEDWWRSRFHDMLYPGHQAPNTHDEWIYRNKAETNWTLIWERFQLEVIEPSKPWKK